MKLIDLQLSFSLAKANFKVRNEGSYLGIFWYLLDPISFFVILLFLSKSLFASSIQKYPLYLFLGLIMFNFFISGTLNSVKVISQNAGFIKSIKIDSRVFVVSCIMQFIFSHIFEIIIFFIFAIIFKGSLWGIIFYPIILLPFVLFILGIGFVLAILGVLATDFGNVWEIFSRLLWFVTPVFYAILPNTLIYKFNLFNPLNYYISSARQIAVYGIFPGWSNILVCYFLGLAFFVLGAYIFGKFKNKLAEKI